jgi:predicted transcriptional regulator
MALVIEIPDELAVQLEEHAAATGSVPEKVAIGAIQRQLHADELLERSLAFAESGMTEEEAVELFEAEKHAMRRERREKRA